MYLHSSRRNENVRAGLGRQTNQRTQAVQGSKCRNAMHQKLRRTFPIELVARRDIAVAVFGTATTDQLWHTEACVMVCFTLGDQA